MDDLTNYLRVADKDLPNAVVRADPPSPGTSVIKVGVCCDKPGQIMHTLMKGDEVVKPLEQH